MKTKLILIPLLFLPFLAFGAEPEAIPSPASSDEAVTLHPIISEGTAAESLKFDPIVPAYTGKTTNRNSTGDISKDIANDLPFHSDSNLLPGNETNFTGIGKGAEETDVSFLGIPINRPQGGGADLGSFPQFLWTGYSYQIGPSLGAFDPRGVGGSLTLRLWTEDALGTDQSRATALYSTRGRDVEQYSYGWARGKTALLAGITSGSVVGHTVALASRPIETGSFELTTHLIASDVDAQNFVSGRSGATTGEQHTYRLLPVIQLDKKLAGNQRLKSSFFYDLSYVRYEDPTAPSEKQIKRTHQVGNETAFIAGNTRIGFGVRHLHYKRVAQDFAGAPPSEQTANVQASHAFRFGTLTVEPTIGGYAITRKGAYPMASIGARNEIQSGESKYGQFIRAGFTKRAPSLLDRYYELDFEVVPGVLTLRGLPNPGLVPENVRSVEAGVDSSKGDYRQQLTLFARDYKHARYTRLFTIDPPPPPIVRGFQIQNAGNAYVFGATGSQDWDALPFLTLGTRVTYQRSKIDDLGASFPNSPKWVGILKADFHAPDGRYGLSIVDKAASDRITYNESNVVLPSPGYNYMDVHARAEVFPDGMLVAGVENVFDREIEFRAGIPDEGRVYSVSLQAQF